MVQTLCQYDNNLTTVEFVPATFEPGKEFYTLKCTFVNFVGEESYTWKIIPSTDQLPALRFNSSDVDGADAIWYYLGMLLPSRIYCEARGTIGASVGVNTGISSYSLLSHSGSQGVTMNAPYGFQLSGWYREGTSGLDNQLIIEADFPIFASNFALLDNSDMPVNSVGQAFCVDSIAADNLHITNVVSGDMRDVIYAANYEGITNDIPVNQVYTARTHLKKNGSVVAATSKAYDFRIAPDAKIYFVYTDKGLDGDDSANLILHITESPWLQKSAYAPDSAYTETNSLDTDYWMGSWQDYDTGDSYTGWLSTNIPIFDSEAKGAAYAAGEIGIDEAINGGDTTFSISTIGDDLSSTDIPTVNLATSGVGCFIYDLSAADIKEIMSDYLYTDDASLKAEYVDALWMWGNNPIDFFIDLYYIPFSITNFYDTVAANLKFGTYQIPDTSYDVVVEANGDRITLFTTSFEGIYGDWRDYTLFKYELYLPYVRFIELDPQKYINKMVSCEMMFDITTHNLRYYIFADGVISDRVDGSVGVNMPLMATDQVNKAKHDRDLKYGAVSGVIGGATSLVVGAAAETTGAGLGAITSGVNSMIGAIKQLEELNNKAAQSVEGSFSSAMNIYDINYAYLKITEKGSIIPDKLHSLYGYPCYYMGKGSALSGYCELSDIRLSGFTGTIDEANALKTILREGVIL